jgi:hypothetical protein
VREKENKNKQRMGEREGQCMRRRVKNFLVALASINHSTTWNGRERGREKKCPPHSSLKRVKVFFLKKKDEKGKKDKNQKITFL